MHWNMSDEQFCDLLDWRHPLLAGIDSHLAPQARALAAAHAIRQVTPRTLTIPQRVPRTLAIWQADYPDDIAFSRDLLERTVLGKAEAWTPDPADYTHINETNLRKMQSHRHQAMPLAARLFALTGDRRYVGLCAGLMLAFVRQAPPCPDGPEPAWAGWLAGYTGMDVVWASHMMENWLLALPLVQRELGDEDYLVFLKALACGADYHWNCWHHTFYHNYTRHGVKAAAGVGLAFPMFRDARKWLQLGIDRYFGDMTAPPLCLADGYSRESIGYESVNAYVTAKWYLLCKAHGIPVPAAYESQLAAMFGFAAMVVKPDGSHPCQGESAPDSSHEHYILAHELLHLGAALFDRPDWRQMAGGVKDDRLAPQWLWVIDPRMYARWKAMARPCLRERVLPSAAGESKLCTLRAGQGLDALCVQTWGLNPRNHGHYDALHLEVYGLGRTLISDAGFVSYTGPHRQREWQAQRHSSIHLVGMQQAAKQFYNDAYTRQLLWQDDPAVAACGLESHLYLDYTIRRYIVLFKAAQTGAVVDVVRRNDWAPMEVVPFQGIETRFALHTPVMDVGRDGLAVWSRHGPAVEAPLHPMAGIGSDPAAVRMFGWADICRVLGWADSNANVRIRPLVRTDATLSLEVQQDWVCVPGGLIPRPVAVYSHAGPLPVVQAWEVRPFRGMQPADGEMAAEIVDSGIILASQQVRMQLAGLDSDRPELQRLR